MPTGSENLPIVSVIVPTKNSSTTLATCLQSIKNQESLELIVVDNHSTDNTVEIAKKYTDKVFTVGPERSAQRNFGAKQARGQYLLFIDSDMELSPKVVGACLEKVREQFQVSQVHQVNLKPDELRELQSPIAIIIPEESFGLGFWAQCKKLERSFYVGVDWMEAARFFQKSVFEKVGGYDESMTSGEDWDLSQRVAKFGSIGRINEYIYHNEGRLSLLRTLRKKIANKFLDRMQGPETTWVENKSKVYFCFCVLYLGTFLGPAIETGYHVLRDRRIEWVWHPVISFITVVIYGFYFLKNDMLKRIPSC